MKLVIRNSSGFSQGLSNKSQTVRISSLFNYLELTLGEEKLYEVSINDTLFAFEKNEDGNYIIPCYMSRENHTTLQLTIDHKTIRIVLKFAEELFVGESLIDSLADFHRSVSEWLQDEQKSMEQLIEAIRVGDIHLLQMINPLTGLDDESILEDVYKVLPFALDICTKPRQHLRMEEEVMDVELVKRVTPSSLQHLASHSEHWRSRTFSGLIPSRLKAEIYEDEINIYENIFFKMVIEAILNYVVKKHEQVKKAISQKDTLHDWEFYAGEINDYHKLEMLRSLLPEYDSESEEGVRKQFKELESMISSIEKQLSSVISTPFFQGLDATKRLELPIQPTNIINMDNRYNELFKVWNKLLMLNNKTQEDLTGASIVKVDEYYKAYVQVLSIYSLHLLGYEFHEASYLELDSDKTVNFNATFSNDYAVVNVQNHRTENDDIISFKMEESLSFELNVPKSFPVSLKDYEEDKTFKEIWREQKQILVFRKKPSSSLIRKLEQVIKNYTEEQKNISTKEKVQLNKLDLEWRKTLSEKLTIIPENRTFDLNLHILFSYLGKSEKNLQTYTDQILNSVQSTSPSQPGSDIFLLPVNMDDFSKVENAGLLQRLINFGEAFTERDAEKYGDYRRGILPVSQTDLRSIQRLSKLFNLFIYRQLLHWGTNFNECPNCKSKNISKLDEHSWQCRDVNCHLVWGTTRCSTGCHEFFEWMKPTINLKLAKQQSTNTKGYHLDKLLLNEMLFDRSVITAFDYQVDKQNELSYYPRCPKCGKSSFN
ncbi:hypothetical protein J2S74_005315 [Evansella vedderi]|uniref:DUF2357 domain-containing protein n=1 Tax=Evansella vedderi TaxID=38282 RepID=A0ABU0A2Y8_9BACI|nr:DUF2357 domain-containing protein [Evansella vedderi]MDQ0257852.1 hypothetical protein [Evansella vedderi]